MSVQHRYSLIKMPVARVPNSCLVILSNFYVRCLITRLMADYVALSETANGSSSRLQLFSLASLCLWPGAQMCAAAEFDPLLAGLPH